MTQILKHLSDVPLKATSGKQTIPQNKGKVFSWVDSDFKSYDADEQGKATKAIQASVYEIQKDATFEQIFSSLGEAEKLCFTQEQIIQFCKDHKDQLSDWYTFFLFQSNGKFFVARVRVYGDGLVVFVYLFSDDFVWCAGDGRRVVVPRLAVSDPQTGPLETSASSPLDGCEILLTAYGKTYKATLREQ
jgi:hypothetical protein